MSILDMVFETQFFLYVLMTSNRANLGRNSSAAMRNSKDSPPVE